MTHWGDNTLTQKAAFKLLCFSDCAIWSLTSLISTCCAKRLAWGLEYLGALREGDSQPQGMEEKGRSHLRKKLAQRDFLHSQGQRPGPTQAPWPSRLALASSQEAFCFPGHPVSAKSPLKFALRIRNTPLIPHPGSLGSGNTNAFFISVILPGLVGLVKYCRSKREALKIVPDCVSLPLWSQPGSCICWEGACGWNPTLTAKSRGEATHHRSPISRPNNPREGLALFRQLP